MVCNALDRTRYRVKPVIISRAGEWLLPRNFLPASSSLNAQDYHQLPSGSGALWLPGIGECEVARGPERLLEGDDPIEIFFIALHGPFGEDGSVQGLMEVLDVAYTGCDVKTSAYALDKVLSKFIYLAQGITTPNFVVISKDTDEAHAAEKLVGEKLGFPCVVKPATQGSSYGVTICHSGREIAVALEESFRFHRQALVEEFIEGVELSCGVLEEPRSGELQALPPIEIVPKESPFFDYHAKYTPGATEEICPARLTERLTQLVQETTLHACKALGVRGFARADFILKGETPFLLEINTIPGMTTTSLLPQEARAAGIEFPELLDRIIQSGLRAFREKQAQKH